MVYHPCSPPDTHGQSPGPKRQETKAPGSFYVLENSGNTSKLLIFLNNLKIRPLSSLFFFNLGEFTYGTLSFSFLTLERRVKKKLRWKENLNLNMICFCPPNMLESIICQSMYCVLSHFSCVWFFVTPWTLTCQAPLFMGFSKQEYWNGLLCPPPGDLPNPGMEPASLMSLALAGRFFTTIATWETLSVQVKACKTVRTMPKTPAEFSDFGPSCDKNWQ